MDGFAQHKAADARLVILRGLARETDHALNETLLQTLLDSFGHNVGRDYVRTQLRALEALGAVRLVEAGTVFVAVLTQTGLDHVQRRSILEGVARPGPEV
ncbi:hypothetical protein AUC70_11795 [Methyloceanibacter stevinii]|uniref:ArsR family transcriptional regulator n=1 Tax=Methyloceanibacter stevinii TaxID=1774970 RepID=A0A1E3VJ41_9HYPH|nr:hypothetical protein [Methyloceanibacter stevinii]ODR93539.1 hypothetical protein AUC70_11795 [Methyloceanibacter stevinii]